MTTRPARVTRAVAVSVLVLALAACAGTDAGVGGPGTASTSSSSAPGTTGSGATAGDDAAPTAAAAAGRRIEVRVSGGAVSGSTGRIPLALGEQVTLVITSDVADEAHVHGYDLLTDLTPGTPAELTFPATVPGVFEVEMHDSGTVLLTLQVA